MKLLKMTTALGTMALLTSAPVALASNAEHFTDRTMTIVIPYGPGGTYDKYGASFSNHIGRFIPGKPTVILQHMPGAGGAKAMAYMYNVAPKAGFHMTVPIDNIVVNQLMRPKKMRFKAQEFNYLGSANQTNVVLVARSDSGAVSVNAWKNGGVSLIGATSGKSSSGYIVPRLSMGLLGLKGRVVTGYKGSSRSILAIEQGEAQMAAFNWLAWSSKVPHWFKGQKPFARAILQIGAWKDPALPNVPMLSDMVSKSDKALVAFLGTAGSVGRGLAYPPRVDKKTVAVIRTAFDKMAADKKFSSELKKRKLRLIPSTGKQIQAIIEKTVKESSPEVIAKVKKIVFGVGS
ncbi:MAG: tripartite tricarboxylate transporter substrate-binding protein [Rhodospirillaceae bacterium]